MSKKSALGKGLAALIPEANESYNNSILELNINDIEPNLDQPRKSFDEDKISALAESITSHGLIQPLIVTKEDQVYKIIAGERRWRAARVAGLKKVPVVVKEVTKRDVLEMALIENLQREDLNPVEEAEAYQKLINEFKMTQEQIADAVGKSRSAVANTLRLLVLSKEIRDMLVVGDLTAGHARALVAVESEKLQVQYAEYIISKGLNVRQTEAFIRKELEVKKEIKEKQPVNEHIEYLEDSLRGIFGTKVSLVEKDNKGKIEIMYYSAEDRERIIELINDIK